MNDPSASKTIDDRTFNPQSKFLNIESVLTIQDGDNSHAAVDTNYSSQAPVINSMQASREDLNHNSY